MLKGLKNVIFLYFLLKNEQDNKENEISFSLLLQINCLAVQELYQRFLRHYQAHQFLTFQLLEI